MTAVNVAGLEEDGEMNGSISSKLTVGGHRPRLVARKRGGRWPISANTEQAT